MGLDGKTGTSLMAKGLEAEVTVFEPLEETCRKPKALHL